MQLLLCKNIRGIKEKCNKKLLVHLHRVPVSLKNKIEGAITEYPSY